MRTLEGIEEKNTEERKSLEKIRRKYEGRIEKKKIITRLDKDEEKYIRSILFKLIDNKEKNAILKYSLTKANVAYNFKCSQGTDGLHRKTLRDKTLDLIFNKCNCPKCKGNVGIKHPKKEEKTYERIAEELILQGFCISNYRQEIVNTVRSTLNEKTVADYIEENGGFDPIIYSRPFRATGMPYVGQTFRDVRGDGKEHLKKLTKGIHHNRLLQEDFNQYGSDNFGECFVLERIEYRAEERIEEIKKRLFEREKYWIEFLEKAFGKSTYNTKNLEIKKSLKIS
jgi:hypothetical protein